MSSVKEVPNKQNFRLRKPRRFIPDSVVDAIVEAYAAGESENALAKLHGVSRQVIKQRLRSRGVVRRGQSEAETVKWRKIKTIPGGIERQCTAAWRAAEDKAKERTQEVIRLYQDPENGGKGEVARLVGCSRSNVGRIVRKFGLAGDAADIKLRRAVAIQKDFTLKGSVSDYEFLLRDAFHAHGLRPVQQQRIGTCNVDFSFPELRVAVELERRYIRDSHSVTTERLEGIFGEGWRVLVIEDGRKRGIDYDAVCQKVIALLDFVRVNPAAVGQYGVIGGNGKTITRAGSYLDGFTRIEGF